MSPMAPSNRAQGPSSGWTNSQANRVGEHGVHSGTPVADPIPILLISRSPRAGVTAVALAAVLLPLGISVAASAPDLSAPPNASPSPMATTWPAPSVPPTENADPLPTLTVEAGDLWFAPNEVSIPSDEPTVLTLVGVGQVAHNLIVDELGLQLYVGPGISSGVTVSDLPPGTYQFYCSIFGHRRAGMFGTLTIY